MIASGHLGAYVLLLLKGAVITLELSLGALVFGSLAGVVLGAMRGARLRPLKAVALLYIEIVRSTPFVILLFFTFYALPLALDIDIPPYPAAVAARTPLRTPRDAGSAPAGRHDGLGNLADRDVLIEAPATRPAVAIRPGSGLVWHRKGGGPACFYRTRRSAYPVRQTQTQTMA